MGKYDLIIVAVLGLAAVGGYMWYQNSMGKINNAIGQPNFVDKLAAALSPGMNKRNMKWNGTNWVDATTGRVMTQGDQVARFGCASCRGMAQGPERTKCLKLCK